MTPLEPLTVAVQLVLGFVIGALAGMAVLVSWRKWRRSG